MRRRSTAERPTRTDPDGWNDTTDGKRRCPSVSASVATTPSRTAATTVFVVPRSIPTAWAIGAIVPQRRRRLTRSQRGEAGSGAATRRCPRRRGARRRWPTRRATARATRRPPRRRRRRSSRRVASRPHVAARVEREPELLDDARRARAPRSPSRGARARTGCDTPLPGDARHLAALERRRACASSARRAPPSPAERARRHGPVALRALFLRGRRAQDERPLGPRVRRHAHERPASA